MTGRGGWHRRVAWVPLSYLVGIVAIGVAHPLLPGWWWLGVHMLLLGAVTNAILDHKMHCSNMTDDEALHLLTQRAFQSEGEALGKIIRAKQSSCQLSTYFVGRMAFHRLRQQVQRELGEGFDLGRYHEAVLAHGTLPVKYLPELVRG